MAGEDEWSLQNRGLRRDPARLDEAAAHDGKVYRVDQFLHPHELSGEPKPMLPGIPPSYTRVSIPRHYVMLAPTTATPAQHGAPEQQQPNAMNLSQHCVPGWGTAQPSLVKPKRTVALSAATDRQRMYTDPDLTESLQRAGQH